MRERITGSSSAIACESSRENRGRRATMASVTTNSRRRITSEKAVATMPTGSASMTRPKSAVTPATILPSGVIG